MSPKAGWLSLCCLLALVLTPGEALSQGTGVVTGRVAGAVLGPLAWALVKVEGTHLEAWTDFTGRYRLTGVPAESQSPVMSLVTAVDKAQVEVAAGASVESNFKVQLRAELVTVVQPLLEGQALARAQQQAASSTGNFVAAEQIASFPDPNVAEASRRIPGVAFERDDGEGPRPMTRGLDPRLNSALMNAERIGSTSATDRTVNLLSVPTGILKGIEVHKGGTRLARASTSERADRSPRTLRESTRP